MSTHSSVVTINLQPGWQGRIRRQSPEAPAIQAGNFSLPTDDTGLGHSALALLRPGHIFINVIDLGPPWPEMVGVQNWAEDDLPLTITADDFRRFEGIGPSAVADRSLAVRWAVVRGHALVVQVSFGGRELGRGLFESANRALAGVDIA